MDSESEPEGRDQGRQHVRTFRGYFNPETQIYTPPRQLKSEMMFPNYD